MVTQQTQSPQHGNANPTAENMNATEATPQRPSSHLSHPLHLRRSFMGVPRKVMQGITALVITAVVNTALLPLANAQQAKRAQEAQAKALEQAAAPTAADRYQNALQALKGSISSAEGAAAGGTKSIGSKTATLSGADPDNTIPFETAAEGMRSEWAELNAKWKHAGVSEDILSRQAQMQAEFEKKHGELIALMKQPGGTAKQTALASFLTSNVPSPTHHKINLDNMPWQVLKATKQEPLQDAQGLNAKLLAATTPTPAPSLKQNLKNSQAKSQSQATADAAAGFLKAATPPAAADLAPTLDAPQTDDIQALASTLGKNPHKIYQWVHDNIYYFPSQGSVQGAQDTLNKKSGNAFDQASLLVALLRASGIPARYVYGTVEIPAELVMNWVGGVKTVDAAQQILGQGGVPNTALVSGGQIKAMRLEHVWVEAYVRNHPDRGANNSGGQTQGDSWLAMDASFKQYTFKEGMNLQTAVPLDANALAAAAQQGAEVNEAEGWVRNINSQAVQTQLKAYQNKLQTYIASQNSGNSTVGDVLGTKTAQIDPLPYLAGTLPYKITARSQQFSAIPAGYQAQFQYAIYADQRSASWGDSPLVNWQVPTASIAGKKVTIAWVAANAATQAAIEALIPKPPAGQELDPSQLPTGLSSSISLKPEIRLDGQTVATGPGLSAGSEPIGAGSFTKYGSGEWDTTTDQLIVGQQTALGISIQGISQQQLKTLQSRMEATKAKLEQAQAAPQSQRAQILAGMTGENLTGDMLTATIWGYFASLQSYGAISGAQAGMIDLPGLQYGLFHAQVQPRKLYGIVTTGISFKGLNMDVGHVRSVRWVKDDNPQSQINSDPNLTKNGKTAAQNRWIAYNKAKGQYSSAMEHTVPDQYWIDKNQCKYVDDKGVTQNPAKADCAQGISAVKAITIAQSQGQKIYTINPSNRDTALPKLSLGGDAGAEIRSAIEAGKEVTFHESSINAYGWHGMGYTITDADTGAGAYLIEGAGNGAILLFLGAFIGLMIAEILIMTVATVATGGLAVGAALIIAGVAITMLIPVLALASEMLKDATDDQKNCFVGGLFLGLGAATFSLGAILGAALNKILFYVGVAAGLAIPSTGDVGSCVRA
ncbi:transglutaminase domain-containing protein [Comamonas odontotermitis]|uniref:transglutaminase domain-containing protein n=1 Tax=Comamonas odontotermitis TaxID=379895 RepID=UPI003670814A